MFAVQAAEAILNVVYNDNLEFVLLVICYVYI